MPADEVLDRLIEWIEEGNTLRAFARIPGNPSKSQIYRLIDSASEEVRGRIARARDEGHDAIAEECLEIADTAEDANIGKLKVWTRLQLLSKWNPKKYGDKVDMNLGGQQNNPIQAAVTVEFVKGK